MFTCSASCQFLELMRSASASVTVHAHAFASARSSIFFLTFLRGVLDGLDELGPAAVPGNSPTFQCFFRSETCGGDESAGRRFPFDGGGDLGPSTVPGNSPAFQCLPCGGAGAGRQLLLPAAGNTPASPLPVIPHPVIRTPGWRRSGDGAGILVRRERIEGEEGWREMEA